MTYTVTNKRDNISNEFISIYSALQMVASCYDGAGIVCEVVNNETGEQVDIYRNPLTGWKVSQMAYTKIKNARLLVDAVNDLERTLKYDPTNQRMIDYYNRQINLLTRRVYK